jgi:hypothetical protein
VICPHCENDTPATDRYCVSCGLAVDLDIETVQASFTTEAEDRAVRETEARCLAYLLSALTLLAVVVLARITLVPAKPDALFVPAALPTADVRAGELAPLPLAALEPEIPKK